MSYSVSYVLIYSDRSWSLEEGSKEMDSLFLLQERWMLLLPFLVIFLINVGLLTALLKKRRDLPKLLVFGMGGMAIVFIFFSLGLSMALLFFGYNS